MATKPLYQMDALLSAVDIYDENLHSLQTTINANLSDRSSKALQRVATFINVEVPDSAWVQQTNNPDIADFPWRASVSCPGITPDYSADVRFYYKDIANNSFAPVTNTAQNTVYIYADAQPSSTNNKITIPAIICVYMPDGAPSQTSGGGSTGGLDDSTLQTIADLVTWKNSMVTSWQNSPDNSHYPSEGLVYNSIIAKGDKTSLVPIILTAEGWDNNQQIVSVAGVLADESKQVIEPIPYAASIGEYITTSVMAIAQGAGTLTFSCAIVPENDLYVYIEITEVSVNA